MTSRTHRRVAAFAVAAGLFGAACGGSTDDAAPVADAPSEQVAGGTEASATPDILEFTSALIGGGEIDAAALSDKPTAFWFWSPN